MSDCGMQKVIGGVCGHCLNQPLFIGGSLAMPWSDRGFDRTAARD